MNLAPLDWGIILVMLAVMAIPVIASRRLTRSVADFLAAGRTAGRYLLSISGGIAGFGAITIVGLLEMNYLAGFSMSWWGLTTGVVVLIVTVSGWVIYRFRQTRSLTIPEFFERRYSRNFRIFAGLIAFISGIVNFGIFPAVGARFFMYYCGLPHSFIVLGMDVSTFPCVMIILLGIALFFVLSGGQVAVIIADFIQGIFVNIIFVVTVIYLSFVVDWNQITEALIMAPENASLVNPFKTSHVEDFNFWYFLIGMFGIFYGAMSWQGTQAYNVSAKSAHEAKMGAVLGNWRGFPQGLFLLIVPIIAYTVLHHPDFSELTRSVDDTLLGLEEETIRSQLRTPVVLTRLLPTGLMGAFAAVMLAAFISTHDTYLHSWASIFVQDVVMPFRKRPFAPDEHIRILRFSILGVALFIFLFSMLFQQSEYIFLFFAITGAIFAGGSGAVIIGGLYWKKGTTRAAWTAMSAGSIIAVGGILIHQIPESTFESNIAHLPLIWQHAWKFLHRLYEINGQQYWALAMCTASFLFIVVSLLGKRSTCDLDRLLHRGKYAVEGETQVVDNSPGRGWKILGIGKEFTSADKVIYIATYLWTAIWTLVFIVGTVYNLTHRPPSDAFDDIDAESRTVLMSAITHLNEGNPGKAAAILRQLVESSQGHADVRMQYYLGRSLVEAENPGEAVTYLRKATEIQPDFSRAWVDLSAAAYLSGDIALSRKAAEKGVQYLNSIDRGWLYYWRKYFFVHLFMSLFTIVWFTLGGLMDIKRMIGTLRTMKRNSLDDGFVGNRGNGSKETFLR
jgi:SSS family solute:Na+ symporter